MKRMPILLAIFSIIYDCEWSDIFGIYKIIPKWNIRELRELNFNNEKLARKNNFASHWWITHFRLINIFIGRGLNHWCQVCAPYHYTNYIIHIAFALYPRGMLEVVSHNCLQYNTVNIYFRNMSTDRYVNYVVQHVLCTQHMPSRHDPFVTHSWQNKISNWVRQ